MPRYIVEKEVYDEAEDWFVIDTALPDNANLVYDGNTEFEARTIAEILNSDDDDKDWDAVSSDWRWVVVEQINRLIKSCAGGEGDE